MTRKKRPQAKLLDPAFKYVSAQDSAKPGYLAEKFARIKYQMEQASKQTDAVVKQIKGRK